MKNIKSILLALLFIAVGCGTIKSLPQQSQPFNLESTKWQVEQLRGKGMEPTDNSFSLEFQDDNRIGAKGACNIIFGSYSLGEGGSLIISSIGATRTACPDINSEFEYIRALEEVTSFSVVDNTLLLYHDDTIVMRLRSID